MSGFTVEQWADKLAQELGLDVSAATEPEIKQLLDLTRVVAHNVARPAGPISTYFVGLAVGLAGGDAERARQIIEQITALVPQSSGE